MGSIPPFWSQQAQVREAHGCHVGITLWTVHLWGVVRVPPNALVSGECHPSLLEDLTTLPGGPFHHWAAPVLNWNNLPPTINIMMFCVFPPVSPFWIPLVVFSKTTLPDASVISQRTWFLDFIYSNTGLALEMQDDLNLGLLSKSSQYWGKQRFSRQCDRSYDSCLSKHVKPK